MRASRRRPVQQLPAASEGICLLPGRIPLARPREKPPCRNSALQGEQGQVGRDVDVADSAIQPPQHPSPVSPQFRQHHRQRVAELQDSHRGFRSTARRRTERRPSLVQLPGQRHTRPERKHRVAPQLPQHNRAGLDSVHADRWRTRRSRPSGLIFLDPADRAARSESIRLKVDPFGDEDDGPPPRRARAARSTIQAPTRAIRFPGGTDEVIPSGD